MKIRFHKSFFKDLKKLKKKEKQRVKDALRIFEADSCDYQLKNHRLHGVMKDCRAIWAGGNIRLVFMEKDKYVEVIFLSVGSHDKVYR